MGTVYRRNRSPYYWISYYDGRGKQIRESSKSDKLSVARELLRRREGEIAEGRIPGVLFERVTFDELADDFLINYRRAGRKSIRRAEQLVKHLRGHFQGGKASQIDTPKVQRYIEARLAEGAANGTLNRELAVLKRMLNLGVRCTPPKVDRARIPYIEMLRESAPRQGFLEHPDFEKLMQHLPKHLKGPVLFGYRSGWRLGEVRGLRWSYVDRAKGIVTLPVGSTKNGAGRTLYLDDELRAMIESLWEARKDSGRLTPWVFLNAAATGQLGSFRKAWATACGKAGIGDKLFHDLRRTACRNMVRAGIPERVAMMVSGHKTRSIFDRYNVVSESDLRAAAEKQAGYLAEIRSAASTLTSTLAHFPPKTEPACNPVSVCDSIGSVSARP